MSLSLQDIYNELQFGETVTLQIPDQRGYDSLRTALIRKFRKSKQEFNACGFDWKWSESYVACKWNKETLEATFSLSPLASRKTRLWTPVSSDL